MKYPEHQPATDQADGKVDSEDHNTASNIPPYAPGQTGGLALGSFAKQLERPFGVYIQSKAKAKIKVSATRPVMIASDGARAVANLSGWLSGYARCERNASRERPRRAAVIAEFDAVDTMATFCP
jgi:hypothetical protein